MKRERQSRILELVSTQDIETQEELVAILKEEGYSVTQATISRDINELRLGKLPGGNGKRKIAVQPTGDVHLTGKYIRVLRDGFVSMDNAQNILVVRTVSGMAMAAAAAIDSMKLPGCVGTIAGDDTIMVAVKTIDDTQKDMQIIKELIFG